MTLDDYKNTIVTRMRSTREHIIMSEAYCHSPVFTNKARKVLADLKAIYRDIKYVQSQEKL